MNNFASFSQMRFAKFNKFYIAAVYSIVYGIVMIIHTLPLAIVAISQQCPLHPQESMLE